MLTCLTDREIEFSELRFIIINIIVVCMCVWSDRAITDAVMHCKGYRTKSKPPRKKKRCQFSNNHRRKAAGGRMSAKKFRTD